MNEWWERTAWHKNGLFTIQCNTRTCTILVSQPDLVLGASTPLKPWSKCSTKILGSILDNPGGQDWSQVNFQLTVLNVIPNVIEQWWRYIPYQCLFEQNSYYQYSAWNCKNMFLLYNATLPSSAVVEHLFIAVETNWLTKHSTVDCCCLNRIKLINSCVGRC